MATVQTQSSMPQKNDGLLKKIIYYLEIEPVLTIRRIIWILAGGWVVAFMYIFAGIILCITIVGIPMGLDSFRWSLYALFQPQLPLQQACLQ